jgi:co-chaperonin GroES (HSP10)
MTKDKRRFTSKGNLKIPKVLYDVIPRHKWVLVRQMKKGEEKTAGGVVLPGADFFLSHGDDKSQKGVVEAVSPDVLDLHQGDFVIFTNFPMEIAGLKELLGRDDLYLVRDEEVYAHVRPKTK